MNEIDWNKTTTPVMNPKQSCQQDVKSTCSYKHKQPQGKKKKAVFPHQKLKWTQKPAFATGYRVLQVFSLTSSKADGANNVAQLPVCLLAALPYSSHSQLCDWRDRNMTGRPCLHSAFKIWMDVCCGVLKINSVVAKKQPKKRNLGERCLRTDHFLCVPCVCYLFIVLYIFIFLLSSI